MTYVTTLTREERQYVVERLTSAAKARRSSESQTTLGGAHFSGGMCAILTGPFLTCVSKEAARDLKNAINHAVNGYMYLPGALGDPPTYSDFEQDAIARQAVRERWLAIWVETGVATTRENWEPLDFP